MSDRVHTVDTAWRENDATALLERVTALNELLEHMEDITEMLRDDEEIVTRLRSLGGLIRSRRNDIATEAEKLRVAIIPVP